MTTAGQIVCQPASRSYGTERVETPQMGDAMADFRISPLTGETDFEHLPWWDVVIVGAGPAGLAAGLTTAHRGLTTLVLEAKAEPGGQPEFLYGQKRIIDVPGFPDGITGDELSSRVYRQARNALVQFRFQEEMLDIRDTDRVAQGHRLLQVVTNSNGYFCRKAIIACGMLHYPRHLPILDQLNSRKVYYRIPRSDDYEHHRVAVVGGGDSALDAAVMVLERKGRVDLIVRSDVRGKADTLQRIIDCGGVVHRPAEITAAAFEDDRIRLTLTSDETFACDLIIVQIGFLSARDTFETLNVRLNDDGTIAVDQFYETSRPGIFAVGDVHGDIRLIPVAWSDGIQAAIYAFDEITRPYWLNERRLRDQRFALIGEKITQAARDTRR
jgi:ferredoxin/flavodoxin---NADP+ reductase